MVVLRFSEKLSKSIVVVSMCVSMFSQGYAEGSHYNEHEGLPSSFISSGVPGKSRRHPVH